MRSRPVTGLATDAGQGRCRREIKIPPRVAVTRGVASQAHGISVVIAPQRGETPGMSRPHPAVPGPRVAIPAGVAAEKPLASTP